jgi:hypothetical protein
MEGAAFSPRPGDPYASAFRAEVGQCWRVVHDSKLQAVSCAEEPVWTGRWHSPRGDGQWWHVWSCPDYIDGLTAVREYGRRR